MDVLDIVGDEERSASEPAAPFVAFRGWTARQLTALRGLGRLERYDAGAVVVAPRRDDDHALFIVVSGELEIERGGRMRGVLGAGELGGELAFVDGRPRTGVIRARTDATVLRVLPADVDRLAEREPSAALEFMREIARILSARLRTAWS
jgi:CRP-like cAMP-binding protein